MSENLSNVKNAMLQRLSSINQVEGFDPAVFAVDYMDLNTGETRKKLPVMIQMAWFRLKYPEGRIALQVSPGKDCFIATARIYPSYKDSPDCYLAEATASRSVDPSKPFVSPMEWAQTAAIGHALRNAGFGLQFPPTEETSEGTVLQELPEQTDIVSPSSQPPEPEPAYEASFRLSTTGFKNMARNAASILAITVLHQTMICPPASGGRISMSTSISTGSI